MRSTLFVNDYLSRFTGWQLARRLTHHDFPIRYGLTNAYQHPNRPDHYYPTASRVGLWRLPK
jgi:hypothetical protein